MWELLAAFALGYIICMFQIRSAIEQAVGEVLAEQEDDDKTVPQDDILNARLETCDGQYLLYNHTTNEFIAQGGNYQELFAAIKHRWQHFKIQIVDGDPDTIQELKAQRPEQTQLIEK